MSVERGSALTCAAVHAWAGCFHRCCALARLDMNDAPRIPTLAHEMQPEQRASKADMHVISFSSILSSCAVISVACPFLCCCRLAVRMSCLRATRVERNG